MGRSPIVSRAALTALGIAFTLAVPLHGSAAGADPADHMPLGPAELITQASAPQTLAPGVTYQKFTQGHSTDEWTVWVPGTNGAETISDWAAAKARADALVAKGFEAHIDTFDVPAAADTASGRVGYGVRSGRFAPGDRAGADALKVRLADAGFGGRVLYTAEDGRPSTGPWEVRVVRVQPTADVALKAVHGQDVAGAETVRAMAKAAGALVAVNGSEFNLGGGAYEGMPQGLYVQENVILGAANNGRTALLLDGVGGRARVAEINTTLAVTAPNGDKQTVDGINRVPGTVLGCGGVGGDTRVVGNLVVETTLPWRNVRCADSDETVIFRPEWGPATPSHGSGVDSIDVVMNGNWVVQSVREPAGGPIPPGGRVLQGIGKDAVWLREHAVVGAPFKPGATIHDAAGRSVVTPALSAVAGGGPALVRGGEVWINTAANGMTQFDGKPNNTLLQRHPRTVAGVGGSGELLLVTIDGRYEGVSVGATWPEAAEVMKWLGAQDAVGLGSGGDTTLIINDTLYNRPMDMWGTTHRERPLSNAVAVVPRCPACTGDPAARGNSLVGP